MFVEIKDNMQQNTFQHGTSTNVIINIDISSSKCTICRRIIDGTTVFTTHTFQSATTVKHVGNVS
jgi:hypothetical protein